MAAPVIKIPGGKRKLAQTILARFPKGHWPVYVEPFLGGGAVYLAAASDPNVHLHDIWLSDGDRDLMHMYRALVREPEALAQAVKYLAKLLAFVPDPKATYFELRGTWNTGLVPDFTLPEVEAPRRLLMEPRSPPLHMFLRHAAFNGLWRVNRKGVMNVPPRDKLTAVKVPSVEDLEAVAYALRRAMLLPAQLDDLQYVPCLESELCQGRACVYLDPPYWGKGGFRAYTADGFEWSAQKNLIKWAARQAARGNRVVYSNNADDAILRCIKKYWLTARIEFIQADRSISCDGSTRGAAKEILASDGLGLGVS